ncbi:sugar transferase [Collinsella tanakaei]|nr:sugar transferase [Collinsella tanakaei]
MRRYQIQPGLTGYWQVGGRSDLDFDDMVELDLKYIRERSLWVNLRTILQTVKVVVTGEGAY